jgi:hypothetical protein
MAKVSNREVYIPKEFLSLKDYFVITDSESFKRTKTVESKHVLNFINKNNGNSNSIYIFSNIQNQDFNTQTEGYFFSAANQQNPDTATKLYFNFKNIFGENVSELFQAIVDSDIVVVKMVNTLDFNNIVYIKPKDILVYEEHFEFDITVLNGLSYGNFIDKAPYVLNFELYDNERSDLSTKLDKGGYVGTAQTLADLIATKADIKVPLKSQFTLVQKSTENTNNSIEINDYARGFGPGADADLEYWPMAIYLNLTGDNNVNNYLNYKPITVSLPNS